VLTSISSGISAERLRKSAEVKESAAKQDRGREYCAETVQSGQGYEKNLMSLVIEKAAREKKQKAAEGESAA
jgi:hypothetical protein